MDAINLLKQFAEQNGIEESKVDEFLKSFGEPKTLDELMALPHDLLEHVDYISYLEDPLYSFIKDEMWCERYMTIELDSVVDILEDRKYNLKERGYGYEDMSDEEIEEELKKLEEVEKHILEIKFGSVVYDW